MKTDNQPLTKGDFQNFKQFFDTVATSIKQDFNSIEDRFDKVDERFDRIEATMATKDDLKQLEKKLETKMSKNKNEILESNEYIIKLLENKKTEDAGRDANINRHEMSLKNYGKRLKKLETV